ncbi:hypothetical protein CK203_045460 [Vitis vinifera]|uniref:Uncharacterized protein n=1 Tax=Vitis vinifera TaxID=29760 RepID=A0A438HY56_VITVI|nr:hypothetical protein CK203_045460 [Vitis vinifera]
MVVVLTLEDAHARMDRLEQRMRQLRYEMEGWGRNQLLERDQETSMPSMPPDRGPLRYYQTVRQTFGVYYPSSPHGPGHDTDGCSTLRHAIQDLIDQGLVNLEQPSVTTNLSPAHTTHSVSPPTSDARHKDMFAPFILWPEDVDVQVMTRSERIA